jgi:thymidylate kinase
MNYIQGQKTFFIEGGDNVGKTTTIKEINRILSSDKSIKEIITTAYRDLEFYKYPSSEMTKFMDAYMKLLNIVNTEMTRLVSESFNFGNTSIQLIELAMHYLIRDMETTLSSPYSSKINICDRGVLSTYLYQFLSYAKLKYDINNTNTQNETILLKLFVNEVLNKVVPIEHRFNTDINVIILYNNSDSKLNIDESETIEYKKNFDHNQILQDNINRSLNNIIFDITESETIKLKPFKIYDITFYRVNIFKYIKEANTPRYVPIRKTDSQLADEIIKIIIDSIYRY